jgi:hypothetical protein
LRRNASLRRMLCRRVKVPEEPRESTFTASGETFRSSGYLLIRSPVT